MNDVVAAACTADEAYAIPLAVMVRSLLATHSQTYGIELFIVDMGLTPATKERLLCSWRFDHLNISWITVDGTELKNLPVWGRMTASTYQRLLMGRCLPASLGRVIWLDCDLMFREDVQELWEQPHDGNIVLAAQDLVVPFVSSRFGVGQYRTLGFKADAPHFNAGLMSVDLNAWRDESVAERAFEYLHQHAHEVWFWDQEALNVVLAGRWGMLDPRWNLIAGVAGRRFFRADHLDEAVYCRLAKSPRVVHWAGSMKPWKFQSARPHHAEWYSHLDQTDWKGWRPGSAPESIGLKFYDSWLRNLLYPCEKWYLEMQHRRGRPAR